jgi:hypothetical protein
MRSRAIAKQYACPKCGAAAGSPCEGKTGPRLSVHRERLSAIPKAGPDVPRPSRRSQRSGYVYAIRAKLSGAIKIGFTEGNPYYRLKQLQTGSSDRLEILAYVPGTMLDEATVHEAFSEFRMAGEWFRFEGPVREWVRQISRAMEIVE